MTNRRKIKNKKVNSARSGPPLLSAPDLAPRQPQVVRRSPRSAPGTLDAGDAREWLTENLADIERRSPEHFDYYAGICEYIRNLPDDDADLAAAMELLSNYDRIPGGRPDVMIDGDPEDTVDAIMEVLDDDEMRIDQRDQFMASEEISLLGEGWTPDQEAPLPRESRAVFVHAMLDRARSLLIADVADRWALDE
jgi:hypothetical protein